MNSFWIQNGRKLLKRIAMTSNCRCSIWLHSLLILVSGLTAILDSEYRFVWTDVQIPGWWCTILCRRISTWWWPIRGPYSWADASTKYWWRQRVAWTSVEPKSYLEVSIVGDFDMDSTINSLLITFGALPERGESPQEVDDALHNLNLPERPTEQTFTELSHCRVGCTSPW